MVLQKTSKETLSTTDILNYIQKYEQDTVPHLNDLWEYYKGKDVKILARKTPDPNNPDNKIIVSYGRKIVTTYTGYAYRPKYITYKPNMKMETTDLENEKESVDKPTKENEPIEKEFVNELQNIYNINNEHIKTNRAGRNTAIFGLSYEICYIDSEIQPTDSVLPIKAIPKFFSVDPRELIALYDFSPEPKMKMAIRFYQMEDKNSYKVEVYYKGHVELYTRKRSDDYGKWILQFETSYVNYYEKVPVVAYYLGDEMQSIMENVLSLIDAHDVLFSDSMNEFDRFAFAYLIMKKFGLTDPIAKKDPSKVNFALQLLKRRRVFENLDEKADIKFLTKDIPTAFIQHIGQQLREQIHIQSHVPDFTSEKMAGASGIAIQRLLFDFENLVSSAEADFDTGLFARMDLIATIMKKLNIVDGTHDMVVINHKRNVPLNTLEFAQTANIMVQAGFSRRAIVGIMPEDIIPDIEKELEYEQEEAQSLMEGFNTGENMGPDANRQKQIDDLEASGMNQDEATMQVMGG
jgi:SPP1 family phage portal protein